MASISLKYKSKQGNLTAPGDVDPGAMIPIATTTVGAGGQSTITFSSIPQNYEHLQIRGILKTNRATYGDDYISLRINNDSGNNYSWHQIVGNGSTVSAGAGSSVNYLTLPWGSAGAAGASSFSGNIIDVLDYQNNSKNKTIRMLAGTDLNGTVAGYGGELSLSSGGWYSTSPITDITIYTGAGTQFVQYTHVALYGIKRAGA